MRPMSLPSDGKRLRAYELTNGRLEDGDPNAIAA